MRRHQQRQQPPPLELRNFPRDSGSTFECSSIPDPPDVTTANPEDVPVSFTEDLVPGGCVGRYTLVRTWRATLPTDNTTTVSHTVTYSIQDTQPPFVTNRTADRTVPTNTIPAPPSVNATDLCSVPSVSVQNISTNSSVRTLFILTDACGNSAIEEHVSYYADDLQSPQLCSNIGIHFSSGADGVVITGTEGTASVIPQPLSSTDFTIVISVRITSLGSSDSWLATRDPWFLLLDASGHVQFQLAGSPSTLLVTSSQPVTMGKWHSIAVRVSQVAKRIELFLDGEVSASTSFEGTTVQVGDSSNSDSIPVTVGGCTTSLLCNPIVSNLVGDVDDFRFWRTSRSQVELASSISFNAGGIVGDTTDLILHMQFDENIGSATREATGTFSGTSALHDNIYWVPVAPLCDCLGSGQALPMTATFALDMAGSNVNQDLFPTTNEFTLDMLVYPFQHSNEQVIVTNSLWSVLVRNGQITLKIELTTDGGSRDFAILTSTVRLPERTWTHVVCQLEETTVQARLRIALNGTVDSEVTDSRSFVVPDGFATPVTFGDATSGFRGAIDSFHFIRNYLPFDTSAGVMTLLPRPAAFPSPIESAPQLSMALRFDELAEGRIVDPSTGLAQFAGVPTRPSAGFCEERTLAEDLADTSKFVPVEVLSCSDDDSSDPCTNLFRSQGSAVYWEGNADPATGLVFLEVSFVSPAYVHVIEYVNALSTDVIPRRITIEFARKGRLVARTVTTAMQLSASSPSHTINLDTVESALVDSLRMWFLPPTPTVVQIVEMRFYEKATVLSAPQPATSLRREISPAWSQMIDTDGSVVVAAPFTQTRFTAQLETSDCSDFTKLGPIPEIRVRMGLVTDYFRPLTEEVPGLCRLLSVLRAETEFPFGWSNNPGVEPWFVNIKRQSNVYGGSASGISSLLASPTDARNQLSAWGSAAASLGGCCENSYFDSFLSSAGRSFDVAVSLALGSRTEVVNATLTAVSPVVLDVVSQHATSGWTEVASNNAINDLVLTDTNIPSSVTNESITVPVASLLPAGQLFGVLSYRWPSNAPVVTPFFTINHLFGQDKVMVAYSNRRSDPFSDGFVPLGRFWFDKSLTAVTQSVVITNQPFYGGQFENSMQVDAFRFTPIVTTCQGRSWLMQPTSVAVLSDSDGVDRSFQLEGRSYSVALWTKVPRDTAAFSPGVIFVHGAEEVQTISDRITIGMLATRQLYVQYDGISILTVPYLFEPGEWHHVTFTFALDGTQSQGSFYIDGALVFSERVQDPLAPTNEIFTSLGDVSGTATVHVDEFAIIDRVLLPAEIEAAATGQPYPVANVLMLFTFDQSLTQPDAFPERLVREGLLLQLSEPSLLPCDIPYVTYEEQSSRLDNEFFVPPSVTGTTAEFITVLYTPVSPGVSYGMMVLRENATDVTVADIIAQRGAVGGSGCAWVDEDQQATATTRQLSCDLDPSEAYHIVIFVGQKITVNGGALYNEILADDFDQTWCANSRWSCAAADTGDVLDGLQTIRIGSGRFDCVLELRNDAGAVRGSYASFQLEVDGEQREFGRGDGGSSFLFTLNPEGTENVVITTRVLCDDGSGGFAELTGISDREKRAGCELYAGDFEPYSPQLLWRTRQPNGAEPNCTSAFSRKPGGSVGPFEPVVCSMTVKDDRGVASYSGLNNRDKDEVLIGELRCPDYVPCPDIDGDLNLLEDVSTATCDGQTHTYTFSLAPGEMNAFLTKIQPIEGSFAFSGAQAETRYQAILFPDATSTLLCSGSKSGTSGPRYGENITCVITANNDSTPTTGRQDEFAVEAIRTCENVTVGNITVPCLLQVSGGAGSHQFALEFSVESPTPNYELFLHACRGVSVEDCANAGGSRLSDVSTVLEWSGTPTNRSTIECDVADFIRQNQLVECRITPRDSQGVPVTARATDFRARDTQLRSVTGEINGTVFSSLHSSSDWTVPLEVAFEVRDVDGGNLTHFIPLDGQTAKFVVLSDPSPATNLTCIADDSGGLVANLGGRVQCSVVANDATGLDILATAADLKWSLDGSASLNPVFGAIAQNRFSFDFSAPSGARQFNVTLFVCPQTNCSERFLIGQGPFAMEARDISPDIRITNVTVASKFVRPNSIFIMNKDDQAAAERTNDDNNWRFEVRVAYKNVGALRTGGATLSVSQGFFSQRVSVPDTPPDGEGTIELVHTFETNLCRKPSVGVIVLFEVTGFGSVSELNTANNVVLFVPRFRGCDRDVPGSLSSLVCAGDKTGAAFRPVVGRLEPLRCTVRGIGATGTVNSQPSDFEMSLMVMRDEPAFMWDKADESTGVVLSFNETLNRTYVGASRSESLQLIEVALDVVVEVGSFIGRLNGDTYGNPNATSMYVRKFGVSRFGPALPHWVRYFGGEMHNASVPSHSLAVDSGVGVFVGLSTMGLLHESITVLDGSGDLTPLTSVPAGVLHAYVIKLNSDTGAVMWALKVPNAVDAELAAIATDEEDSVYVLTSSGQLDCLVTKVSSTGVVLWSQELAANQPGQDANSFTCSQILVDRTSSAAYVVNLVDLEVRSDLADIRLNNPAFGTALKNNVALIRLDALSGAPEWMAYTLWPEGGEVRLFTENAKGYIAVGGADRLSFFDHSRIATGTPKFREYLLDIGTVDRRQTGSVEMLAAAKDDYDIFHLVLFLKPSLQNDTYALNGRLIPFEGELIILEFDYGVEIPIEPSTGTVTVHRTGTTDDLTMTVTHSGDIFTGDNATYTLGGMQVTQSGSVLLYGSKRTDEPRNVPAVPQIVLVHTNGSNSTNTTVTPATTFELEPLLHRSADLRLLERARLLHSRVQPLEGISPTTAAVSFTALDDAGRMRVRAFISDETFAAQAVMGTRVTGSTFDGEYVEIEVSGDFNVISLRGTLKRSVAVRYESMPIDIIRRSGFGFTPGDTVTLRNAALASCNQTLFPNTLIPEGNLVRLPDTSWQQVNSEGALPNSLTMTLAGLFKICLRKVNTSEWTTNSPDNAELLVYESPALENLETRVSFLTPDFDPLITEYEINVGSEIQAFLLVPTLRDLSATMTSKIENVTLVWPSGNSRVVEMRRGVRIKYVYVQVTSAPLDGFGSIERVYTVKIQRELSSIAELDTMYSKDSAVATMLPPFSPDVREYTVTVLPVDVNFIRITVFWRDVPVDDGEPAGVLVGLEEQNILIKATLFEAGRNVSTVLLTNDAARTTNTELSMLVPVPSEPSRVELNVTSENGGRAKLYVLRITARSNNALLSNRTVLTPNILTDPLRYPERTLTVVEAEEVSSSEGISFTLDAEVPYEVHSVTISADPEDPGASWTVVTSSDVTYPVLAARTNTTITVPLTLVGGVNTVILRCTAVAENTVDYIYRITRLLSADTALLSFVMDPDFLQPAFQRDLFEYELELEKENSQVFLTFAEPRFPAATLEVNGKPFGPFTNESAAGVEVQRQQAMAENRTYVPNPFRANRNLTFDLGIVPLVLTVTAADGHTTFDYVITVTRFGSRTAQLARLALRANRFTPQLVPPFASDTYVYTVDLADAYSWISFTPTLSDPTASVTLNEVPLPNQNSRRLELPLGQVTEVRLRVLAEDSLSSNTYVINVHRNFRLLPPQIFQPSRLVPDEVESRSHHAGVGTSESVLVACGGLVGNLTSGSTLQQCAMYMASSRTWVVSQLSEARAFLSGEAVGAFAIFAGGVKYPCIGCNDTLRFSNRVDVLVTSESGAGMEGQVPRVGSLLGGRRSAMASAATSTAAFFGGGEYVDAQTGRMNVSCAVDEVRPRKGATPTVALHMLRTCRAYSSAAVVGGRYVVFAGGFSAPSDSLNFFDTHLGAVTDSVEILDTQTGEWTDEAQLSVARAGMTSATGGGVAYFFGGVLENGSFSEVIDFYDGVTWGVEVTSEPRVYVTAALLDSHVLFYGGLRWDDTLVVNETVLVTSSAVDTINFETGRVSRFYSEDNVLAGQAVYSAVSATFKKEAVFFGGLTAGPRVYLNETTSGEVDDVAGGGNGTSSVNGTSGTNGTNTTSGSNETVVLTKFPSASGAVSLEYSRQLLSIGPNEPCVGLAKCSYNGHCRGIFPNEYCDCYSGFDGDTCDRLNEGLFNTIERITFWSTVAPLIVGGVTTIAAAGSAVATKMDQLIPSYEASKSGLGLLPFMLYMQQYILPLAHNNDMRELFEPFRAANLLQFNAPSEDWTTLDDSSVMSYSHGLGRKLAIFIGAWMLMFVLPGKTLVTCVSETRLTYSHFVFLLFLLAGPLSASVFAIPDQSEMWWLVIVECAILVFILWLLAIVVVKPQLRRKTRWYMMTGVGWSSLSSRFRGKRDDTGSLSDLFTTRAIRIWWHGIRHTMRTMKCVLWITSKKRKKVKRRKKEHTEYAQRSFREWQMMTKSNLNEEDLEKPIEYQLGTEVDAWDRFGYKVFFNHSFYYRKLKSGGNRGCLLSLRRNLAHWFKFVELSWIFVYAAVCVSLDGDFQFLVLLSMTAALLALMILVFPYRPAYMMQEFATYSILLVQLVLWMHIMQDRRRVRWIVAIVGLNLFVLPCRAAMRKYFHCDERLREHIIAAREREIGLPMKRLDKNELMQRNFTSRLSRKKLRSGGRASSERKV